MLIIILLVTAIVTGHTGWIIAAAVVWALAAMFGDD